MAQVPGGALASRALRKISLFFYGLLLAAVIAWEALQMFSPSGSLGKPVTVPLQRGAFTISEFLPEAGRPRALVIFASGDGGWSGFEEAICRTLQQNNYAAFGFDCRAYADTDYDLATLQSDFAAIARKANSVYPENTPPLIFGGWSMGAAQVIAAAGGPHPAPGVIGLLLVDPCSRGRYGLRLADQTNILPTGPGTFAVQDFSAGIGDRRVVQWHAVLDSIDSRAWLDTLAAPHKEYDFEQAGHYYNNDRVEFLARLVDSIAWILRPGGAVTAGGGHGP